MAKHIKLMQMESLRQTFRGVHDLVFLTGPGLDSQTDNRMRLELRKKDIRLQVVKNSLARKVFDELGLKASKWEGRTVVAWGGSSIAGLSKEIAAWIKKNEKAKDRIKPTRALTEGQEIDFATAMAMPTREEAIGRVVMLAQSPGRRLVGQLIGPGGYLAGQVKAISEKPEAAPEAPPAAEAAPAPA
jgi:large subunit ribosomal protein L10